VDRANLTRIDLLRRRLSCPLANDCWAVGQGSNTSGNVGVTDASTTGGLNWTQQTTPSTLLVVQSVDCPSASACYALGTENNGAAAVLSGRPPS
jgi:hypothetical protein